MWYHVSVEHITSAETLRTIVNDPRWTWTAGMRGSEPRSPRSKDAGRCFFRIEVSGSSVLKVYEGDWWAPEYLDANPDVIPDIFDAATQALVERLIPVWWHARCPVRVNVTNTYIGSDVMCTITITHNADGRVLLTTSGHRDECIVAALMMCKVDPHDP